MKVGTNVAVLSVVVTGLFVRGIYSKATGVSVIAIVRGFYASVRVAVY